MDQREPLSEAMLKLLQEDRRFNRDTYEFIQGVLSALDVCASELTDAIDVGEMDETGHVTAMFFCRTAVSLAVEAWGLLARPVLSAMGLNTTEDIGDAVFNLVEIGEVMQSDEDSLEDFYGLFDLAEELESNFEFMYGKNFEE